MRYKRNLFEAMIYLILLVMMVYWRKEGIFNFLLNERFLNVLTSSTITLSGIGMALLGVMFVLPEREGLVGEMVAKSKKFFSTLLRRCTAYFLLSSVLAFLSSIFLTSLSSTGYEDMSVAVIACSGLSFILFLSGLLYLLYVCLKIEEVSS